MLGKIYSFAKEGALISVDNKLTFTVHAAVIALLITLITIIPGTILDLTGLYQSKSHPMAIAIGDSDNFSDYFSLFIAIVILTPILEELSFRLVQNTTNHWSSVFGISFFLSAHFFHYSGLNLNFFLHSISLVSVSLVIGVILTELKLKTHLISPIYVVYFTSISFAVFHLKVIGEPEYFLLYSMILLPYFLRALIYSFVRMNAGIIYSIICHAIFNSFFYFFNVAITLND